MVELKMSTSSAALPDLPPAYYYLVESDKTKGQKVLYTTEKPTKDNLIVSEYYYNGSAYRKYKSAEEYYHYYKNSENKHSFEIIQYDTNVKLFYDLDIDLEKKGITKKNIVKKAKEMKNDVIQRTIEYLNNKFKKQLEANNIEITEDDFTVYESHRRDKQSYHIILNNVHFNTVYHLREMFHEIFSADDIQSGIDSIHNGNRAFRMLGSSKIGTPDVKNIEGRTKFNKKSFLASLVQYIDKDSTLLDFKIKKELKSDASHSRVFDDKIFNQDTYEKEEDKILFHLHQLGTKGYVFDQKKDGILLYKRAGEGFCVVCSRAHQKENGFAYVRKGKVYFNCRRSNRSLFLYKEEVDFENIIFNPLSVGNADELVKLYFDKKWIRENPFDSIDEAEDFITEKCLPYIRYMPSTNRAIVKYAHEIKTDVEIKELAKYKVEYKIGDEKTTTVGLNNFIENEYAFYVENYVSIPTLDYENPKTHPNFCNVFPGYGEYTDDKKYDEKILKPYFDFQDIFYEYKEDKEHMDDLITWCLHNNEPPQIMPLLYSAEGGVGKSLMMSLLKDWVFGYKYNEFKSRSVGVEFSDAKEVGRNFMGENFLQPGKSFFYFDELVTESGQVNLEGLKSYITGREISGQRKGKTTGHTKSQLFLMAALNKLAILTNVDKATMRRLYPVKIREDYSKHNLGDNGPWERFWKPRSDQLSSITENNELGKNLFTYYATRKISKGFSPTKIPITPFRHVFMDANMDYLDEFFQYLADNIDYFESEVNSIQPNSVKNLEYKYDDDKKFVHVSDVCLLNFINHYISEVGGTTINKKEMDTYLTSARFSTKFTKNNRKTFNGSKDKRTGYTIFFDKIVKNKNKNKD